VLALRYVYVLALSIWFGGMIMVGGIITPVSDQTIRRFFLTSYVSGTLVITSLFAMALLGPRPSGYFARVAVAAAMLTLTLYSGLRLHTLSMNLHVLTIMGGLALLFWEARDGTLAA
jgi:hypothetical protein